MKRWWIVALLLLSIGLNIGLLVGRRLGAAAQERRPVEAEGVAQGHGEAERPMPRRLRRMLVRMAQDLSLEGENERRFLEIQETFFRTTLEKRAEVRRAQRALRRHLISDDPQQGRAEELLAAATTAQSEMEQAFVANFFATHELLETPEQKRLLRRFMARLRQMREEVERRFESQRFENRRRPWQRNDEPQARSLGEPRQSAPGPDPPGEDDSPRH